MKNQKKTASELEMQEHFEALDAAPAAGVDRALAAAPAAEGGQLGGGKSISLASTISSSPPLHQLLPIKPQFPTPK